MDKHSLQAFKAVADLHSFSQAAELLHLTQPAVTRRIQILEEQCGQKLFDRIGRQISLTEAGSRLLPYANRLLELMQESKQALDDLAGEVRGQLRLLTSHHIGLHRLPVILREYKARYPAVQLHIRFYNSQEIHQHILDGDGDLGVTTAEPIDGPLLRQVVWHDTLHFVVAPDHPLAQRSKPVLRDISAYPAILPDARFFTGRVVRELFAKEGIALTLDQDLSTDYLETIKALISIGRSWSVLPHTMLDERFLVALRIRNVALRRQLVCIRHPDRTLSRAALALLDLLKEKGDQEK